MNFRMIVYIVIALLAVVLLQYYQNRKRNEAFNSLLEHLNNQDYDGFDKQCESAEVQSFIPAYNLNFLKLNAALMRDDKQRIEDTIASFDSIRMNEAQKKALYDKCFYYYISTKNKEKAELYYQMLMSMKGNNEIYSYFYDTYVQEGTKYLDEILSKVESLNSQQKIPFYTLIADMYRNAKDDTNAKKYDEMVKAEIEKMKK